MFAHRQEQWEQHGRTLLFFMCFMRYLRLLFNSSCFLQGPVWCHEMKSQV